MASSNTDSAGQTEGLSHDEREALLKVMERAKEFDKVNKEGRLQTQTEGQLYKWTNPLKGWQPRWFYVDQDQGVLHYCMSEERRKQPPRASLHLWGAVVSPSDEDSQSFSVQGANNDCYKLKAANAKERQSWVSKLRQEVEHANVLAVGPKEALQSSSKSSTSLSGTAHSVGHSQDLSPQRHSNTTTPARKHGRRSVPLNLSLNKLSGKSRYKRQKNADGPEPSLHDEVAVIPGGEEMVDALTRLQIFQESLMEQLELLCTEAGTTPENKDVLILKATSQAAVQGIQDSLGMMDVQIGRTSRGSSPTHKTMSPTITITPTRRVPLRQKRPMSMIDTTSQRYQDIEQVLDNNFLKSSSVSEMGESRKKESVANMTSKEAP